MSFMFRCCCRPFLKGGDDGSRPYYDQLALDKECSTEDIKRAYKKKSLELHPDKLAQRGQVLTPEDQARFQRVKEAYEVLVDPKRRDLYDEFGETGLKLIEDPQSMDPQTAFVNFMRSSSYDRCAIFMTIVGVTLFVLMWPVLLCLQTDTDIEIPWTAIWTPLWVLDALCLFVLWFLVFTGNRRPAEGLEEEWRDDLPARVLNAVQLSCNVLFQIFLTLKLDDVIQDWDWSHVFAPWLAWEGIQLFRNLTITSTGGGSTNFATSTEEGVLLRAMAVRQAMLGLQHGVLRIVFCALAILKLDGKIHVTWWVVFVPLWLFFVTQILGICVEYALAKRLQENLLVAAVAAAEERGAAVDPETGEVELGPEETMIQEQAELMASRASMMGCQAAVVIMMALLGVARLEGAHYSVFVIFLPVFVIVGCFTCSLGCAVCCLREPEEGMGVMGRDGEHRPLNPAAQANSSAGATSTTVAMGAVGEGHKLGGNAVSPRTARTTALGGEGKGAEGGGGGGGAGGGATSYQPPAPLPVVLTKPTPPRPGNSFASTGEEIDGID